MQEVQVQFLVGELRPHVLPGMAKNVKNIFLKRYNGTIYWLQTVCSLWILLVSFENLDFNMPVSESVTIVSVTCSYYKCKYSCYNYQRNNTLILAQ